MQRLYLAVSTALSSGHHKAASIASEPVEHQLSPGSEKWLPLTHNSYVRDRPSGATLHNKHWLTGRVSLKRTPLLPSLPSVEIEIPHSAGSVQPSSARALPQTLSTVKCLRHMLLPLQGEVLKL